MSHSLLNSTINHFQQVFPSLTLPAPTLPLHQYLDNLTSRLPVPPHPNLDATLNTMRHLIDAQEYKHQNNLLSNPEEDLQVADEEANRMMADCYEQGSTYMGKKETSFTNAEESMLDVWSWVQERGVPEPAQKEEYLLFID